MTLLNKATEIAIASHFIQKSQRNITEFQFQEFKRECWSLTSPLVFLSNRAPKDKYSWCDSYLEYKV